VLITGSSSRIETGGFTIHCLDPLGYICPYPAKGFSLFSIHYYSIYSDLHTLISLGKGEGEKFYEPFLFSLSSSLARIIFYN
jgi:hypothetical protein